MIKQANSSDDSTDWSQSILSCVGWITNDDWCSGCLVTNFNTSHFSLIIKKNFIWVGVKHIGSSMDSAKSWESFGKATKTIDRIQKWWLAISSRWVQIQLHFQNGVHSRLEKICVLIMESDCVSQKISCRFLNTKFGVDILKWNVSEIHTSPSGWVIWINTSDKLVQSDYSLFFEHAHQLWF